MTDVSTAEAVWDDDVLEVTFHDEKGFILFGVYIYPETNKALIAKYLKDEEGNWTYESLFEGEVPNLD